jgi:uncharacterized OB-fold protein
MRATPYPDRDSQPWWDALRRHELMLPRCDDCGAWRWPPRALCGRCASLAVSWQPWAGTGTIVSVIRTHQKFLPDLPPPFWTVFVAQTEQADIIMPGTWFGAADPVIGMAVRAHLDDVSDDDGQLAATLVGWEPTDDHAKQ